MDNCNTKVQLRFYLCLCFRRCSHLCYLISPPDRSFPQNEIIHRATGCLSEERQREIRFRADKHTLDCHVLIQSRSEHSRK